MLKKLNLNQLENTKTNFFKNIKTLFEKKRYPSLKDFLKDLFKNSNEIYFIESGEISLKIEKKEKYINFIDFKEGIILSLTDEEFKKLNNKLKLNKLNNKGQKSISDTLFDLFKEGKLNQILDKPFLVYDIETIGNINNLEQVKFMMGYVVISNEDHLKNIKYRYVGENSAKKFTEFMLSFDGYIIGYNNISFDNPVMIYNSGLGEKELKTLNQKSIDLFLFLWNLTGRRLGLNAVAKALINIKKTLSSGLEGEKYLKEYIKTKDEKLFSKVKTYCKNDVKMTLGILLYLLHHNKIFINNQDYEYNIETLTKLGTNQISEENNNDIKSLF